MSTVSSEISADEPIGQHSLCRFAATLKRAAIAETA